jgi:uncharacterized protein (DUF885 family)
MRARRRVLAWVAAGLVLLATAFGWQALFGRPWSIDGFFARVHREDLAADPERASLQRRLPRWLDHSARRLTDLSPAADSAGFARARRQLALLDGYNCDALTLERRTSCRVLRDGLASRLEGERWRYHGYPLTPVFGLHDTVPAYLAGQHQILDRGDAEDYLTRLRALPAKFDGLLEGLAEREQRGMRPPRLLVEQVLSGLRAQVAPAADVHLLYSSFSSRLERIEPALAAGEQARMLDEAEQLLREAVYPAYARLIAHFEKLAAGAAQNRGVWALPDGDAYYAYLVRLHTSSAISPDEAHALGIREVARLHIELDAALRAVDLRDGAIGDRLQQLAAREDQRFAADRAGRVAILAHLRQRVAEAETSSRPWFERWPTASVRIEPVPVLRARAAPGAYYTGPAADGSRPGVFWVNLRNVDELPRFALATLAHHEAVPGHHLQSAWQLERDDLPAFRALLAYPAFAEGWAMYAERLASEVGPRRDPLEEVGRLQAEMFRAVRLVVDTGLHHRRWSREQAIDYLREKTGLTATDAVAEVERYLVLPGQALSFQIGLLRILALRERAQRELGPRFDLRRFHTAVLDGGRLPLDLLEWRIERYIADERR